MDDILRDFLTTQRAEAMRLADESDLLDLVAIDEQRYVAEYSCKGLVLDSSGAEREHEYFGVGIRLPETYLRHVQAPEILTWLGPREIWHPNIRPPHICIGPIAQGTPLVDLLHRCFEVITYQNVVMREDDALNRSSCAWARRHRERFPIDPRPIKRQTRTARTDTLEVTL